MMEETLSTQNTLMGVTPQRSSTPAYIKTIRLSSSAWCTPVPTYFDIHPNTSQSRNEQNHAATVNHVVWRMILRSWRDQVFHGIFSGPSIEGLRYP